MDSNMNEKTLPGGETLVKAGLLEIIAHYIEILNITHSWYNVFAYALKPIATLITYYQAVRANKADFIYRKRIIHGENFVCAGGIWMCEFGEIKKNLIQPQARAFKLGSCELDHEHIPRKPDGSILFLLSLSQKGAAGEGSWEAYRAAFEDYITDTKESKIRMNDTTVEKLYHALGVGYKKNGMQKDGDFFDDDRSGINDFLLRYLHYVLLGIDPFDEEKFAIIRNLHYDSPSAVYYLKVWGKILQNLKFRDWPDRIKSAVKVYEESPALSLFEEGQEKYKNLTKNDLASLSLSIMALAGMVGPKTLACIVLGNRPLPTYHGQNTHKIDVVEKWDQLNLNDREEVNRYILECGRLRHPVSNTHTIALEDFTAIVGNEDVKFKKGTIIYIPMMLAGLDKGVYGADAFEFNHNERTNLCPFSTIYHSFGKETNGRVCPGKHIAQNMVIDVLIRLGKCRQEQSIVS